MLTVNNLNVFYDAIHAIHDVSFHVDEGEIVTLIGANGAGRQRSCKPSLVCSRPNPVKSPSSARTCVRSNHTASSNSAGPGAGTPPRLHPAFGPGKPRNGRLHPQGQKQPRPGLRSDFSALSRASTSAASSSPAPISGGEQQMLAIGRALMSKPKLLLMDEPSMGLSPILVQEIFKIIRDVRDSAPPSSSSSRTPGSAEDRG